MNRRSTHSLPRRCGNAAALLSLVLLLILAASIEAQTPRVLEASAVVAESAQGYSRLVGLRELSDGRVIVADEIERSVYLLRPDLSPDRTIGAHGEGPGEYQTVGPIVRLEGDSSAVRTNRGFLIITPDGSMEGSLPRGGAPIAVDRDGYLYGISAESTARMMAARGRVEAPQFEPITIERWHRHGDPADREMVGTAPEPIPTSLAPQYVPFTPRPTYAVSPSGSLVVLHPDPYRVEVMRPGADPVSGPVIAYDPVPVSEGHKEEWRASWERPRPMLQARVGAGPGTGTWTVAQRPVSEPSRWPAVLPAYLAMHFEPDGTLWVQRSTEAGAPPLFDVFDEHARRVHQVRLPPGTRLLGFGEGVVYVARTDEFDLEYVQRIRRP